MVAGSLRSKPFILVVEDEPLLRLVAVDMIEEAGFEVLEAGNADDAIAILKSRSDIRLVFTDINMPGSLDGVKLAAFVRDRWPPIEIIATSAHGLGEGMRLPDRGVFLPKPYDAQQLTTMLHRMVC